MEIILLFLEAPVVSCKNFPLIATADNGFLRREFLMTDGVVDVDVDVTGKVDDTSGDLSLFYLVTGISLYSALIPTIVSLVSVFIYLLCSCSLAASNPFYYFLFFFSWSSTSSSI